MEDFGAKWKSIEKLPLIALWSVLGIVAWVCMQAFYEFHFYYVEQLQLFIYNKTFLSGLLYSFGGLSEIISRWLIQFFIHPYIGALITTLLLLTVAMLMQSLAKKINRNGPSLLIPLLTAISLFFLHLNHNYYVAGTIALILTLASLLICIHMKRPVTKIAATTACACLLFWWAGSVAFLFVLTIITWQLLTQRKQIVHALVPLLLLLILAYLSVERGLVGDYQQVFLPTLYFHPKLTPPSLIYYPWGLLFLLVLFASLPWKRKMARKRLYLIFCCQMAVACAVLCFLLPKYGQLSSAQYKKLDYYARMGRWNDIVEERKKPIQNLLHLYYLHIALMETNQLANQFMRFDQKGVSGLVPITSGGLPSLIVCNELNFTLGDIAAAQHYAFEGNINISKTGSPRLYLRLIQTNLINGEYRVAEKYIRLLEQTHFYKKWATAQRRFLYNDQAVEEDPLLGKKRRGLPKENYLLAATDPIDRVQLLAKADRNNTAAVDYLASIFLFEKQMTPFKELIEAHYSTEVSPTALPERFQEAIMIIYEDDPQAWARFGISKQVMSNYENYRQLFLENSDKENLADILYPPFGHTYWYYFMFYN